MYECVDCVWDQGTPKRPQRRRHTTNSTALYSTLRRSARGGPHKTSCYHLHRSKVVAVARSTDRTRYTQAASLSAALILAERRNMGATTTNKGRARGLAWAVVLAACTCGGALGFVAPSAVAGGALAAAGGRRGANIRPTLSSVILVQRIYFYLQHLSYHI